MRKRLTGLSIAALTLVLASPAIAQTGAAARVGPTATFDYMEYRATGEVPATPADSFRNPVLPGFQPDPSIVRVGDDFYLTNSTFSWFPGLPIYHSRDLVNWNLIGHAIDRPGMVDFSGLGTNRALFAPAITYGHGKFWIVNTCIECGNNFVITADRPEGPWSDPVWLPFGGIDPSLYFAEDGTTWITYNDAPAVEPRYEGHRAIWIQQFFPETMSMAEERTLLVDGGVNPAENPIWAEGPHIYKVGDWYYLLTAEGGTADQHSQTIYRSRELTGPYTPGPINPILTQRNMDPNRPDRVEATGHADAVELDDGTWWGVFLATRPFAGQSTLMGRETFLLPMTWEDGWPRFLDPGEYVPAVVKRPNLPRFNGTDWSRYRDDFTAPLSGEWIALRTPVATQQWGLDASAGQLWVTAGPDAAGSLGRPSFTGRRLRHHQAEVSTRVSFAPAAQGDFAGLLAFMDEGHFLAFGVEGTGQGREMVARLRYEPEHGERGQVVARAPLPGNGAVDLRLNLDGGQANLAFRAAGSRNWQNLGTTVNVEPLSSIHAGLFTGVVIGPYAVAGE
ncbi:glycoside hydrolase family 43 protein [Altererythrobacter lauratis]|uniref:Glycoside hydrolase family 43 protein n=1 Tax=Alteraurantiacibacter lauratis TaxID=2054627 RepID=A0ABV7EG50_9SPHN